MFIRNCGGGVAGVAPGLENSGEDQIVVTSASAVHHLDIRCNWKAMDAVSEWRILPHGSPEG